MRKVSNSPENIIQPDILLVNFFLFDFSDILLYNKNRIYSIPIAKFFYFFKFLTLSGRLIQSKSDAETAAGGSGAE